MVDQFATISEDALGKITDLIITTKIESKIKFKNQFVTVNKNVLKNFTNPLELIKLNLE